jgi:hypothetical protein
MQKLIYFLVLCFVISLTQSIAQISPYSSVSVSLDSSGIVLTNVKVDSSKADGTHLDPNNVKDTAVINVTISISHIENIDSLQIRYGSEKGDFFNMNLKQVLINGKSYFKWYDFLYPVSNGTVTFSGMSTHQALSQASLMVLTVKDKSGNLKSILPN